VTAVPGREVVGPHGGSGLNVRAQTHKMVGMRMAL
jgi:hypothetical protein